MTDVSGSVTGKAYGFFDSDASIGEVREELYAVHGMYDLGPDVGLSLILNMDMITDDPGLISRAGKYKYAVGLTSLETKRKSAGILGDIFNCVYVSPLFNEGDPFNGEIIFEEGGRYLSGD